jgi:hypothetical protein
MSEKQRFVLKVDESGALSAEQREELLLGLTEELRLLPRLEVERGTGAAPAPGEKSVGGLVSELVVQIAGSAITLALPPLVGAVREWIGRQPVISEPVTITCNGVSMEIAAGTPTADVTRLMLEASKGALG